MPVQSGSSRDPRASCRRSLAAGALYRNPTPCDADAPSSVISALVAGKRMAANADGGNGGAQRNRRGNDNTGCDIQRTAKRRAHSISPTKRNAQEHHAKP